MGRLKDTEIDIITDAMTVLLVALMRLNNDELTKIEFDELIRVAMQVMLPLTKKRNRVIEKILN